ncbi:hypothetical protein GGTG_01948 [Gaeumannomyces tritici R3-111a-1]|uniref:Uncharacterized protein n=1 Tax=Gaeumannomyces tritici (strain R3-111a-1) TaxID=644352 RepID=J3NL07_GAET3|nr:hypothetical protein GGTG_01948 [Gaeumannomyces tritici R3-111a-1]EJT81974.1 hypothetical protein GGTG_01948 [Gaeumannomyces tritici R3-111a-1]
MSFSVLQETIEVLSRALSNSGPSSYLSTAKPNLTIRPLEAAISKMPAVRQYPASTFSQAAPEGALGRPTNYSCPDEEDKNDSQGRDVTCGA